MMYFQVTVEEGLRDIYANITNIINGKHKPGMGADDNVYIANRTISIAPFARTGLF